MFKRWLERVVLWATERKQKRDADKVKSMYRRTLDAALAATRDFRNGWRDGFLSAELPELPPITDGDVAYRESIRGPFCAQAYSRSRFPHCFEDAKRTRPICNLSRERVSEVADDV